MLLVKVHRVGKGIEGCGQVRKDVATSTREGNEQRRPASRG